jgi:hypothetical protein
MNTQMKNSQLNILMEYSQLWIHNPHPLIIKSELSCISSQVWVLNLQLWNNYNISIVVSQLSILSSELSTLTHQLCFLNFHISAPSFQLSMLNDKLLTFIYKCPTHQNGELRCTLIWKLSVTALSRMTILSAPSGEIVWLAIPQTWHGGNATTISFTVQTSITRRSGYLERLYCMIIFECYIWVITLNILLYVL